MADPERSAGFWLNLDELAEHLGLPKGVTIDHLEVPPYARDGVRVVVQGGRLPVRWRRCEAQTMTLVEVQASGHQPAPDFDRIPYNRG